MDTLAGRQLCKKKNPKVSLVTRDVLGNTLLTREAENLFLTVASLASVSMPFKWGRSPINVRIPRLSRGPFCKILFPCNTSNCSWKGSCSKWGKNDPWETNSSLREKTPINKRGKKVADRDSALASMHSPLKKSFIKLGQEYSSRKVLFWQVHLFCF